MDLLEVLRRFFGVLDRGLHGFGDFYGDARYGEKATGEKHATGSCLRQTAFRYG